MTPQGKKNAAVVAACCVCLAASAWVIVKSMRRNVVEQTVGQKLYFTVDDGETWFVDDSSKMPPFEHDGKEAVAVFLYSWDGGRTKQVSYLLKFEQVERENASGMPTSRPAAGPPIGPPGALVKRKGDKQWVRWSQWVLSGTEFVPLKGPAGTVGRPVECYPE